MGYTLGDTPDVERYSRVARRKRRRETTDEGHVDTELDMEVVDAASALVTDAETQTCDDECKRIKDELALFKQTNQDLCSSVADLTVVNDRLSLSTDFLRNNPEKLKFYTGNHGDFR